ncbi:hypothetical protein SLS54_004248 [Diplodia seriata]
MAGDTESEGKVSHEEGDKNAVAGPSVAASSFESAKKSRRRVTRTGSTTQPKALFPMKGEAYGKRVQLWVREADVAAYLFLSDQGLFRQLLLSYPVLEAYMLWRKHSEYHQAESVFATLVHSRNNEEMFPLDKQLMLAKWGREEPANKEKDENRGQNDRKGKVAAKAAEDLRRKNMLCSILVRLVDMVTRMETFSEKDRLERQAVVSNEFERLFEVKIPPGHDLTKVPPVYWGPITELGEEAAEPYNRAFNLLKRLHYVMTGGRWNDQFGSSKAPFQTRIVPADAIPLWMTGTGNNEDQDDESDADYITELPEELPPHGFELVRDEAETEAQDDLEDLLETHVRPMGLAFPEGVEHCSSDPRVYPSREEFLDTIRNQLDFRRLRLQFFFARVELSESTQQQQPRDNSSTTGKSKSKSYSLYGAGKRLPWVDLRDLMKQSPQGRIIYNIQAIGEGESPLEFTGVPLSLSNYLQLDAQGDVCGIEPDQVTAVDPAAHQSISSNKSEVPEEERGSSAAAPGDLPPGVPGKPTPKHGYALKAPSSRAEASMRAYLSGVAVDANSHRKFLMPADIFSPGTKRGAMLREYSDYDAFTKKGLQSWQLSAIDHALSLDTTAPKEKAKSGRPARRLKGSFKVPITLSESIRDEIKAAEDHQTQSMLLSDDAEYDLDRHYEITSAFSGSMLQTGLAVRDSRLLLGLKTSGHHEHDPSLELSATTSLNITSFSFLDHQASGAAWMLQRTLGFVPNYSGRPDDDDEVEKAMEACKGQRTYGGILADGTGAGKTATACLFASAFAKYMTSRTVQEAEEVKAVSSDEEDESEMGEMEDDGMHRPILLLTFNGPVLKQWQTAIYDHFPELELIVSYDEKPTSEHMRDSWVSKGAMEAAPHDLEQWPKNLRYVFDRTDPRASRTVILCPYDTWVARSLTTFWEEPTDDNRREARYVRKLRKEMVPRYESKWEGVFSLSLSDEAHRLRHEDTLTHRSVKLLRSPVNWLLTATPQLNEAHDIVGLQQILWPSVKQRMTTSEAEKSVDFLSAEEEREKGSWAIFEPASKLPFDHPMRNIVMDPYRMTALLNSGDLHQISTYAGYTRDALICQRSPASLIPFDREKTRFVSLRGLMPEHVVKTIEVSYSAAEAAEAQWLHRCFAREYEAAMARTVLKKAKRPPPRRGGKASGTSRFPPILCAVRRLNIASSSTIVSRLDLAMRARGLNTLVQDMRGYRSRGHSVEWIIKETRRPSDTGLPLTCRKDKLRYLCWGSPKLRLCLAQVRDTIINGGSKLLITEDTPLMAWYFELVLQFLHVETHVLHADLTAPERQNLVDSFNDPKSSLKCLILMYNVSSQGVNLHGASNVAFVATGAINAGLEMQAWGRLIRIAQKKPVTIIRCQTRNSFDQFRDSRQREKQKTILATTSYSSEMTALLVKLLNEGNCEVREAHNSPIATLIRKRREQQEISGMVEGEDVFDSNHLEWENNQALATTVQDNYDVESDDEESLPMVRASRASRTNQTAMGVEDGDDNDRLSDEDFIDDEDADSVYSGYRDDQSSTNELEGESMAALSAIRPLIAARQNIKRMSASGREDFDQALLNYEILLALDPDRVYQAVDLEENDVHERALSLLYRARFGQTRENIRLTPHVRYDALHPDTAKQIEANVLDFQHGLLEAEGKGVQTAKTPSATTNPRLAVKPPSKGPSSAISSTSKRAGTPTTASPTPPKKPKADDVIKLTKKKPELVFGKSTTVKELGRVLADLGVETKKKKKSEIEQQLKTYHRTYNSSVTKHALCRILDNVGVVYSGQATKKTLLALWAAWIDEDTEGASSWD